MENTLRIGDFLFVNKFIYGAETPKYVPFTNIEIPYFRLPAFVDPRRGDVIVFEYPGDRDEAIPARNVDFIKRCIALPGDTLLIQNKMVFVNGREFLLPAHAPRTPTSNFHPRESVDMIFPRGSLNNPDYYGPIIVPFKGMVVDISNGSIEQWQTFIEREHHRVDTDQTEWLRLTELRQRSISSNEIIFSRWEITATTVSTAGSGVLSPKKTSSARRCLFIGRGTFPFPPATSLKRFRRFGGRASAR